MEVMSLDERLVHKIRDLIVVLLPFTSFRKVEVEIWQNSAFDFLHVIV